MRMVMLLLLGRIWLTFGVRMAQSTCKVDMVEISLDIDVVAIAQVSLKQNWMRFTIKIFDFGVDVL